LNTKTNNREDVRSKLFCLHLLNGRTMIPKTCIHNYECGKCAFDQWLDETEAEKPLHVKAA